MKPAPTMVENPITPEDEAQNKIVTGKPIAADFVSYNGFEKQLSEHGYERVGDQWLPRSIKPLP